MYEEVKIIEVDRTQRFDIMISDQIVIIEDSREWVMEACFPWFYGEERYMFVDNLDDMIDYMGSELLISGDEDASIYGEYLVVEAVFCIGILFWTRNEAIALKKVIERGGVKVKKA